ncbi:U7 snRNA-associated Sm-like protein LSm10 isoform X1 [Cebidichthys violaceus]|uniref:U7 snRNA-associated Sm-like protein LSm10 isoform X1 n=1 Tax=Cebidichthys violaceus TaxID=271503 RepID=UPI0035C99011
MESEKTESPAPSPAPVAEVFNSIRERAIAENSMVVLLQGLQGEVTTVDLRNESTARGRVVNVDAFMNVRLEDVLYRDRRGKLTKLQDLFITGRNVRYVHIPDHVDIMKTIQSQLAKIHRVRNFASHGGGRKEFEDKHCTRSAVSVQRGHSVIKGIRMKQICQQYKNTFLLTFFLFDGLKYRIPSPLQASKETSNEIILEGGGVLCV